MKKHSFYTELSYVVGLVMIALSVALVKSANFGVSMIVAPAYLLNQFIEPHFSAFTFGMAEYCFQGFLILVVIAVLRKFRLSYLFSFVTAVLYGFILDGFIFLVSFIPNGEMWQRIILFIVGQQLCTAGVALMFRTYISPESYELLVMEISKGFKLNMSRFKWAYDIMSCLIAIAMSFIFFGKWRLDAIGVGTLICAATNGPIIGLYSKFYGKLFIFKDALPFRKFFTGEERI